MNSLTLDEIRDKAIEIIRENPRGIRQNALILELSNLFFDRLSGTSDPKSKIRNAVWNLETKTDQVIKQSVGPREVVFLPVIAPQVEKILFSDNGYIKEMPAYYEAQKKVLEEQGKMLPVWFLLSEIEALLSRNEEFLNRINSMTPAELAPLSKDDVEVIFELKHAISALRRARNNIVHRR